MAWFSLLTSHKVAGKSIECNTKASLTLTQCYLIQNTPDYSTYYRVTVKKYICETESTKTEKQSFTKIVFNQSYCTELQDIVEVAVVFLVSVYCIKCKQELF